MQKSKGKIAQENFLQYLLNEYILFRRNIFYEIPVAPEILVEKLQKLKYENNSWWGNRRRIIPQIIESNQTWQFELIAEQPGKSGYVQSAKASGIIYVDDNITFIEGCIIMSLATWILNFMLIAFVILMSWQIGLHSPSPDAPFISIPFIIIGIIGFLFFWIQMYSDRNHLAKIIEQAVESVNEPIYN